MLHMSYANLDIWFHFQVFLVRKAAVVQKKVLSVRVEKVQSENAISHFPVRESQYSKDMYSTL